MRRDPDPLAAPEPSCAIDVTKVEDARSEDAEAEGTLAQIAGKRLDVRGSVPKVKLGPFSRKEATHQTVEDAKLQVSSGEIWGRIPRWSQWPAVQAYGGRLKGNRGIEFTTDTDPHPNGLLDRNSPFEVRWYLGLTPGVLKREKNNEEFACILADVVNLQP